MPSVKGFRIQQPISEQIAAMDALLAIEGRSAGEAVARRIETQTIQGPGLVHALFVAEQIPTRLMPESLLDALRHPSPLAREAACDCV